MNTTIPDQTYSDFSLRLFRKATISQHPLRGQIELTYKCNIRCVHCYTDCHNNPEDVQKELPFEEVIRLLDQIYEAGCLWLLLTGGEIFMRKDFFHIYEYAKKKGFLVTLFTNATMITPEIADRLEANPPFSIETSCHGGTAEVFERITQVPGSFRRFVEGVHLLLDRGLPLKIKTKAMTLNRSRLQEIKQLVEGFGLRFRLSTAIYPDLKGSGQPLAYRLTPAEIVELELGSQDLEDEEDGCLDHDKSGEGICQDPPKALYRCGCGTNTFIINPYGKLGSCVWTRQPEIDLGGPFSEALERLFHAIRSLTYRTASPCGSCRIFTLCAKNPGAAIPETGDREQAVEHFCNVAHLKARRLGLDVYSPFEKGGGNGGPEG
ncbi:MAG: radical SAM protein [Candidatus Binatia bacterium]